jgi:hypothetical protein
MVMPGASVAREVSGIEKVACIDCHLREGKAFSESVHVSVDNLDCRTCHGGEKRYSVETGIVEQLRQVASRPADSGLGDDASRFDHGSAFRGKPTRRDIPQRCGTCHADVTAMNPYGLATDQLAQYRTSGHGRALYQRQDERVAVCTDCHGTHNVMKADDPASPVHAKNVPDTCGRCHEDASLMGPSQLSTRVVAEYRRSVHGQGLLEQGDVGMPHCATCHGSHAAVPPGYRDVGHVCGRCHQQEEQHFLASPHAKFSMFPRCVGCHTPEGNARDHWIRRVAASPEVIRETYARLLDVHPGTRIDDPKTQAAFEARREPPVQQYETICLRCHHPRVRSAHRAFFSELDAQAAQSGATLYQLVRQAELSYAAATERVERVGRGVLLVTDEALLAEEMRTKLVSLAPIQHALNEEKLTQAVEELNARAEQVHTSLDDKVRGLRWRYWALLPIWSCIAVFVTALWVKYKQLKHALVAEGTG